MLNKLKNLIILALATAFMLFIVIFIVGFVLILPFLVLPLCLLIIAILLAYDFLQYIGVKLP